MSRLWTRPDWHAQWGYRLPQVEEHTVYLRHAPENWPGATALFVSDVHLGPFAGREFAGRLAEQMRALEADLLLLGGDYAETGADMRVFLDRNLRVRGANGQICRAGQQRRAVRAV